VRMTRQRHALALPNSPGTRSWTRLMRFPHSLSMFEAAINAVHRAAPDAAIAFNARPEDSADAAARWLKAD